MQTWLYSWAVMTSTYKIKERHILNSGSLIYWHKFILFWFILHSVYFTCVLRFDFINMKVLFLGIGLFGLLEVSTENRCLKTSKLGWLKYLYETSYTYIRASTFCVFKNKLMFYIAIVYYFFSTLFIVIYFFLCV